MDLSGLKSRKLIVGGIAAVGIIVNDVLGHPVSDEAIYAALGVLGTYIIAQGVADHGAQGAAKAAERAIAKGSTVAAAVTGVLGQRMSLEAPVHDAEEDDGAPEWGDATAEDDGPGPLNE